MCGRYIPNTEDEIFEIREILREISLRFSDNILNEFDKIKGVKEIYPNDTTPIIISDQQEIAVENVKWGFEKWDNKGVIINARSESAAFSKFFSTSVKNYRCVVPCHGYFEWQKLSHSQKIKFEFNNKSKSCLFFAGLYRKTPKGKEYVILTTQATDEIEYIHNRMPLILEKSKIKHWLNGTLSLDEILNFEDNLQISFKKVN